MGFIHTKYVLLNYNINTNQLCLLIQFKQQFVSANKIISDMKSFTKRSISVSQFEKQRITQDTFKRNKQYFDLQKVDNNQKNDQVQRRRPALQQCSPKSKKIDHRIKNSFTNSLVELSGKVDQEMRKFKDRVSPTKINEGQTTNATGNITARSTFYCPQRHSSTTSSKDISVATQKQKQKFINSFQDTNLNPQSTSSSLNKIKGISINKQLTRDYLYRYHVEKKSVIDERNFNNFRIVKNDLSRTQDFRKLSPRGINFINKQINVDLQYNGARKQYQKVYFSNTPMKSTFRYSVQNSKVDRKFYIPQKAENIPKTVLNPQKLMKSFTEVSNFKTNKIDPFYKMTSRHMPHQIDQRNLSPNRNYYTDKEGRLIPQKVDYVVKKMYDEEVQRNKAEHFKKKNPQFTRDQICDERYFKEMIKREKRMADRLNL